MRVIFEIKDEDFVNTKVIDDKGVEKSKTLTVDEFESIIIDSRVVGKSELIDTSKFLLFTGDKQNFDCVKVFEATKWAITWMSEPMIVKLPTLLFRVDNKGNMYIYVTKSNKPNLKSEVYKFDYPNMLHENTVCFGSFVKRAITLDEVDSYIFEYMATPYSHAWTASSENGIYTIDEKHLIGTVESVFL